jgi:thioredoxin-like negative regulator of GroEL
MFIFLKANWCGHCKALKPIYNKAAERSTDANVKTQFAAVDCGTFSSICQKFKIEGYPTLKLFKNGKVYKDYSKERTAKAILQFLKTNEDTKDEL